MEHFNDLMLRAGGEMLGRGHVQINISACPYPFLDASLYPKTGGGAYKLLPDPKTTASRPQLINVRLTTEIETRFCAAPNPALLCCLPCPLSEWVFSDTFEHQVPIANYISIGAFVLNCLLLLTFGLLPEEKSHRHYLSMGLTLSLLLLSIAFIIPLSTKPDLCYDDITPNNMHSDLSCAWSGALLLAGGMGVAVWSKLSFLLLVGIVM